MRLGAMQDFPLRIMRILDHAEREHGAREIVGARADGSIHRTNWTEITDRSRRLAKLHGLNRPRRAYASCPEGGAGPRSRTAFPGRRA